MIDILRQVPTDAFPTILFISKHHTTQNKSNHSTQHTLCPKTPVKKCRKNAKSHPTTPDSFYDIALLLRTSQSVPTPPLKTVKRMLRQTRYMCQPAWEIYRIPYGFLGVHKFYACTQIYGATLNVPRQTAHGRTLGGTTFHRLCVCVCEGKEGVISAQNCLREMLPFRKTVPFYGSERRFSEALVLHLYDLKWALK